MTSCAQNTVPIDLNEAARHAFFLSNALAALYEAMPDDEQDGPRVAAKCMVGGLSDIAQQLALALGGYGGTLIDGQKVEAR
jgi:hypothetical protein